METATEHKLLNDARTLRGLIEQEQQDDDEGDVDVLLLMILDLYIRDWEYQLGIIPAYADREQRLIFLRMIVKLCNLVDEQLQAEAEVLGVVDNLPPAVAGLLRLLFQVVLSVTMTIEHLEGIGAEAIA
jgi:hypothetical protein